MTAQQLLAVAVANKRAWQALMAPYGGQPYRAPASVRAQADALHAANERIQEQLSALGADDAGSIMDSLTADELATYAASHSGHIAAETASGGAASQGTQASSGGQTLNPAGGGTGSYAWWQAPGVLLGQVVGTVGGTINTVTGTEGQTRARAWSGIIVPAMLFLALASFVAHGLKVKVSQ